MLFITMRENGLQITKRSKFGYEILDLSGEISFDDSRTIDDFLKRKLDVNTKHVILNLENVTYINSSALSLLIKTVKELSHLNVNTFIMNANSQVKGLIKMTGLDRLFNFIPDENYIAEQATKKDVNNILESEID